VRFERGWEARDQRERFLRRAIAWGNVGDWGIIDWFGGCGNSRTWGAG
jgi:hypothetical protein